MEEIYLITRLDSIQGLFIASTCISVIFIALLLIALIVNITEGDSTEYQNKAIKITIPILIISVLGIVFTPTTKEDLMIWGVGGTIDYVKSNEIAKQLPDKVVNAFDTWVNSYLQTDSIK